MSQHPKEFTQGAICLFLVLATVVVLRNGMTSGEAWYKLLLVTVPLLVFSLLGSRRRSG